MTFYFLTFAAALSLSTDGSVGRADSRSGPSQSQQVTCRGVRGQDTDTLTPGAPQRISPRASIKYLFLLFYKVNSMRKVPFSFSNQVTVLTYNL